MKLTALLGVCALLGLFLGMVPSAAGADTRRAMTLDDLFRFKRVSAPRISPDGKLVVYVVGSVDLGENKVVSHLWLTFTDGQTPPRQLTNAGKKDRHPRWSPDGKRILFESTRSGDSQLWVIDVHGGEARQLTTISTEAGTPLWSPDGKTIAFVSAVWPEYSDKPFKDSDAANKKRKDEAAKNPVKAKVFTKLFFRHWDEYVEDKRQHLFVMSADGGEPKDVTPGDRDANPTSTTFSAGDDYAFSPDSSHLVFTAPPERDEAWSTNYTLNRVPVAGGKVECLTPANPAASGAPRFAPDGKHLIFRAQQKPGYEADRWRVRMVACDRSGAFTSTPIDPLGERDLSVEDLDWLDAEQLLISADEHGEQPLFLLRFDKPGVTLKLSPGVGANSGLSVSRDGTTIAFLNSTMRRPNEVFVLNEVTRVGMAFEVSRANQDLLAELDLPTPESVTVKGAGGTPMQMWILKPPGFDPKKKWPVVYLVHGGPQGAWENGWSNRWNPQLWAAQGYVVALPNPRGSTGFGQKYVDEISGDWGGKCYDDLLAGVDYLERNPYVDTTRMAAAGASFGGYMMNWFEGHTTVFKTLISHCGVYNFDSMYLTTEEIWFDEWEHGGPPWGKNRESYEKHSPHRYAADFKTPMLIIHNDLDFRVPVSEGIQLFTTLQRLGVPSKMINFPDEGHWVLKPKNSEYWHKEVFAWLAKYAPPGGR